MFYSSLSISIRILNVTEPFKVVQHRSKMYRWQKATYAHAIIGGKSDR